MQPNVAVTTDDSRYLTSGFPIPTSTHVYNRSGRADDPVDGVAFAAAVCAAVVVPPVVGTENDLKCGKLAAPAGNSPTALAATTATTDSAKRPVRLRVCFDMFRPLRRSSPSSPQCEDPCRHLTTKRVTTA